MKTLTEAEYRLLIPFLRIMQDHNNKIVEIAPRDEPARSEFCERYEVAFENELFDVMGLPADDTPVVFNGCTSPEPFGRDAFMERLLDTPGTDEQMLEYLRWLAAEIENRQWRVL